MLPLNAILRKSVCYNTGMLSRIRFENPVVFVRDIAVSRDFYRDVLGLDIVQDAGVFVLFRDHFSIHQAKELQRTVFGSEAEDASTVQGRNNLLLYFESAELEEEFSRLKDRVRLIHPILEQHWGQKVFRFYDPDGHIVEIGEPMNTPA
jgi:catechol 2,3-dioxygenase-like lactoylglutathione lyase family enzyme